MNPLESHRLWSTIPMYFKVGRESAALRFRADTNHDSYIDTNEFKNVINDVWRMTQDRGQRAAQ